MYDIEYKWTKREMVVTTTNIKEVTPSKRKPQFTYKRSTFNQLNISTVTRLFDTLISKNKNQAINVVNTINKKAIKEEPVRPKKRPIELITKKESRGKKITLKYIL
jgi:hypothetical protein